MQSSFPYFDILIFGVIAVFLILRLKNILGTKTDANNQDINNRETSKNFSNIFRLKKKGKWKFERDRKNFKSRSPVPS